MRWTELTRNVWRTDSTRNVIKKVKCMWRTDSNQNVIKKVKLTFPGASHPYTLREIIQSNGGWVAQNEKTSAPALPKFIIVDVGKEYRGPTFFPGYPNRVGWVTIHPITDQCILNLLRLVGIVENTIELCSLWYCVGPGQPGSPKVKQYEVNSV